MRSLTCSVSTGPNSEVRHVARTPYMFAVEVILALIYSLDILKGWLDRLLRLDVVAVDVCGELAPSKGATPEDLRVNLETNIELQEFILDHLKR